VHPNFEGLRIAEVDQINGAAAKSSCACTGSQAFWVPKKLDWVS